MKGFIFPLGLFGEIGLLLFGAFSMLVAFRCVQRLLLKFNVFLLVNNFKNSNKRNEGAI
jgi:hypothetical protein